MNIPPGDILQYGFVVIVFIQLLYFWGLFSRFAFKKTKERTWTDIPVSVIIVAKNEDFNLQKNLPAILEQEYKNFEVIVVSDGSVDDTELLLIEMQAKYPHLNPIILGDNVNFFYGKKFPLSIGIKSAKYEHLLLTDADCEVTSKYWINDMASSFEGDKKVILGYGAYHNRKGLLNAIIRFETVQTAIQYLSYAIAGIPYMGVGRNLAYTKALFFEHQGFISHYRVGSGDDDLFIKQVANKRNTSIQISQDSFTLSEPEKSFGKWWGQKKRHYSSSGYYKPIHKFLLSLYPLTSLLFYVIFGLLIYFRSDPLYVYIPFALRMSSLYTIYGLSMHRLKESKLIPWIPVFEIGMLLLSPVIMLSNLFFRRDKW